MLQRRLGKVGPLTYPLGLGCMGMSDFYGPADRAESLATIHAALDAGINVLDTGDFYGMGHNELLIAEALQGVARDRVVLSVKFGAQRDPAGRWLGYDASPVAVKTALAYTLKRLHTDYIDIYRPARLDPKVPIEDTVGAMADMVAAGYVRAIGLSEVGRETIRRAAQVHPICDLQMEYSLLSRGVEKSLLATCRELGIGMSAYAVLSRGLISDRWDLARLAVQDFRSHSPRFQGPNEQRNREILEPLRELARSRGVTMAQMAIAWVLARGDDIVPLIGARTRETLRESLGALAVTLSPAEIEALDRAFPEGVAAGARYGEPQMAHLDSERP